MGGTIHVESEKGVGSKFQFQITCLANVFEPIPMTAHKELTSELPLQVTAQKILVVDDNPLNQKVLVSHLTQKGHFCQTAPNGQEAVALVKQCSFHVILMDVLMPVMDGFEATKKIRELEKKENLPPAYIIGISGNAREIYSAQGIACGMSDYLSKPYQKEILFEMINHAALLRLASPQVMLTNTTQETNSNSSSSSSGNATTSTTTHNTTGFLR